VRSKTLVGRENPDIQGPRHKAPPPEVGPTCTTRTPVDSQALGPQTPPCSQASRRKAVSGGSSGTTTGLESGSDSAESMAEPFRDLGGMPDFGDGSPVGCKGKIDLLFVISREANMQYRQAQLAAAFPQFIETIKSKFADFDYHIMVVTGDDGWGNECCTELCATPRCKRRRALLRLERPRPAGSAVLPRTRLPVPAARPGDGVRPDVGGGRGVPGGVDGEANKPCPIDGGRRYLVKGQSNLEETFECIATVGASGWDSLGQALVAAVQDGDPITTSSGAATRGSSARTRC
jgi:hypothetical protein